MADRKPSTVAAYLKAGQRLGGVSAGGGRGRRGPLGAWLLREKAAIVEGRAATPALTWREVSTLAATDGVVRRDGTPYPDSEVRKAWSNLANARLVPRGPAQAVPKETVSPPRGQGGTAGASGVQPPAPMPPSTAAAPSSEQGTGEAAPKQTFTSAMAMPRVKGLRSK